MQEDMNEAGGAAESPGGFVRAMGRNLTYDNRVCAGEEKCTVVIFTHSLLEPSMTFIVSHAEGLQRYRPVYAGARRVDGLALPEDRTATANRGGVSGAAEEFLFRRIGFAPRLVRRLRRFRPGLVHAHFGSSGPAGLTLARSLGVPLIVTYHGQDATITDDVASRSWRGREYLRGRGRVMREATLILAVSDFIRGKLVTKGYPSDKVVTHRNGIDIEYFRLSTAPREPVVVFVGRFVEKKGCEYLVHALGSLRRQGKSIRAVLIGDGPLRTQLERLAAEQRVDATFTGFLPLGDVRQWLGRAYVVAVPSVTAANGDSEGLPTVILEAQAMGTPVVATRHAGNAEGVAEERSAILVDERDVEGLAKGILRFFDEPDAVERFGRAGRAFVESNFALATQVRRLEELYDDARARALAVACG
jgi:glycosyltransferase involved in cell wall biosynthesis